MNHLISMLQNLQEQTDMAESRLKRIQKNIGLAYASALDRKFNFTVNILIAVLLLLLFILLVT
jgi:hypothetical protein